MDIFIDIIVVSELCSFVRIIIVFFLAYPQVQISQMHLVSSEAAGGVADFFSFADDDNVDEVVVTFEDFVIAVGLVDEPPAELVRKSFLVVVVVVFDVPLLLLLPFAFSLFGLVACDEDEVTTDSLALLVEDEVVAVAELEL